MGNIAPLSCGKIVTNLGILRRISCERSSTLVIQDSQQTPVYADKPLLTHCLYQFISDYLSPRAFSLSPLMNTIFTQFPQHLLLLQLKKI
jgi:hypothetical protein